MAGREQEKVWADLLARIEAGEWADFAPDANGHRPTIEARLIKDLLLGRPVMVEGAWRSIMVPQAGLRLRGATIEGPLDLDDAAGPGGGPLPPIIFADCVFSQAIRLARAHLRHLSLTGSRLTHLNANDAVIDGPLDLGGVRSAQRDGAGEGAQGQGLCWVEMRGARIEGSVSAGDARFVAPPARKDYDPVFTQARFALDLWNAKIAGSLSLTPGLYALGGLSIQLSRVDGEVWCDGAELISVEGNAFCADEARIEGSLYCRAAMPMEQKFTQFRASGGITLYNARIAGSLNMSGATLSCGERTDYYALDAGLSSIGGAANFGPLTPLPQEMRLRETEPLQTVGGVSFASATIAGDFSASGARLDSNTHALALDLSDVRIGGNADFDVHQGYVAGAAKAFPFQARGAVNLFGARIGGSLTMRGASLEARRSSDDAGEVDRALIADNLRVGLHAELTAGSAMAGDRLQTFPFSCTGSLRMFGAEIEGILNLDGAILKASREAALFAQSARFGYVTAGVFVGEDNGARRIYRFEATGGVSFQNARIAQSMTLTGSLLAQGGSDFALDLQEIEIGGTSYLTADVRALDADGQPVIFEASGLTNLSNAHVRGDLNASGAKFSAPGAIAIAARNLKVGGSAGFNLFTQLIDSVPVWLRFVAEGAVDFTGAQIAGVLSLTGASLNAKGPLWALSASGATLGDMRIDATETIWDGKPRAFRFEAIGGVVLDNMKIARNLSLSGAQLKGPAATASTADPSLPPALGWALKAEHVEVGGEAVLGSIEVTSDGTRKILPIDSDGLVSLVASRIGSDLTVQTRGTGRWSLDRVQVGGRTYVRSDFSDEMSFREASLGAALIVRRMSLGADGPARPAGKPGPIVDLANAHAALLDDDGGGAWGSAARLGLEGFRYDRVAEPRPEWKRRLRWLKRQAGKEDGDRDRLKAYSQLANALDAGGFRESARHVSFARRKLEQKLAPLGIGKAWRFVYGATLGYGIFPERLVLWLFVYWFSIMLAVQVASTGRLEISMPGSQSKWVSAAFFDAAAAPVFVVADREGVAVQGPKDRCTPPVQPDLYALDLILGPMDLGEEKRCIVDGGAGLWAILFRTVATLGLIVSLGAPLLLPIVFGMFARRFSS